MCHESRKGMFQDWCDGVLLNSCDFMFTVPPMMLHPQMDEIVF